RVRHRGPLRASEAASEGWRVGLLATAAQVDAGHEGDLLQRAALPRRHRGSRRDAAAAGGREGPQPVADEAAVPAAKVVEVRETASPAGAGTLPLVRLGGLRPSLEAAVRRP